MHIPVYRDITIISNTNIEFPIPPNITVRSGCTFTVQALCRCRLVTGFAQVVVVVFKSNTVAEVMELLAMYKFAKKGKPFFCYCMRMRVR